MQSVNMQQLKSAADYYFEYRSAFSKYSMEDSIKLFVTMTLVALTDYLLMTYFAVDLSMLAEGLINFIVENL